MPFDPKKHLTKLQGKDYLEVKWRLVWFRETHPAGAITTELVAMDPSVVVKATVSTAEGILSTGYGSAAAAGKGPWTGRAIEKAETAAIGRALGVAGFGTQFDADDETDNIVDSPVAPPMAALDRAVQARMAAPPPRPPVASHGDTAFFSGAQPPAAPPAGDGEIPAPRTLTTDEATALYAWATASNGDIRISKQDLLTALGVAGLTKFVGTLEQAKSAVLAWKAAF